MKALTLYLWASPSSTDISDWDLNKVKNMDLMLFGATTFNQPLAKWDTSSLESASYTFGNAISFKVEKFQRMFDGAASFRQDFG